VTQPSQQVNPWLTGVDFAIQAPAYERDYTKSDQPYTDFGSAVAGGAGYSLSPDEANDMLTQANNALTDLMQLRSQIEGTKRVTPPAQDPASVAYNARLASGSGVFVAGVTHVDTEIAYLNELIGKITEAFKKITGHEPEVAKTITQAGTNPSNTGPTPNQGGMIG
jgi:hypothetical protein